MFGVDLHLPPAQRAVVINQHGRVSLSRCSSSGGSSAPYSGAIATANNRLHNGNAAVNSNAARHQFIFIPLSPLRPPLKKTERPGVLRSRLPGLGGRYRSAPPDRSCVFITLHHHNLAVSRA